MTIQMIKEQFERYECETKQDVENALKEISQNIALLALFRAEFFKRGAFHGGTCLRILYGLVRFSEDLDFCLIEAAKGFHWKRYMEALRLEFAAFGIDLEIQDRSSTDGAVKKIFLKDDSVGKLLDLQTLSPDGKIRKTRVKLEIDTNPPEGARIETRYTDFPIPFPVSVHDLPTCFAGKMHALLCREYTKGRDWYDFVWYTSRRTALNREFLKSALDQAGPWKGQGLEPKLDWIETELSRRIGETNWALVREELSRFVRMKDLEIIDTWTPDFIQSRIGKLTMPSRN